VAALGWPCEIGSVSHFSRLANQTQRPALSYRQALSQPGKGSLPFNAGMGSRPWQDNAKANIKQGIGQHPGAAFPHRGDGE